MAGGENFRKDRSARLRHRFFRKGKWIIERYGRLGCVGCGRCDRNCLAKINSVEDLHPNRGRAERNDSQQKRNTRRSSRSYFRGWGGSSPRG